MREHEGDEGSTDPNSTIEGKRYPFPLDRVIAPDGCPEGFVETSAGVYVQAGEARREGRQRMNLPQRIGAEIRRRRQIAGITQAELGPCIHMERENVSRLERGLHMPRISTLYAVAHALGVSVGALLPDVDPGDL